MDLLTTTALQAADAAARIHRQHFGRVGLDQAREKGQSDFVSRVDLEAQDAAVSVIRAAFPDHFILAEEGAVEAPRRPGPVNGAGNRGPGTWRGERLWPREGGYLWIIDPLDGTTNFLHGHPMFAASVGVGREGRMEAGAVVAAATGERWWARRGEGARKNGDPVRVSRGRSLEQALVGTGFPFKAPELVPRYLDELGRVLPNTGGVRRGGAAALDLCYLAEGILDAFWEEDYLSPWDTAAGLIILEEAGGVACRMDGSPLDLKDGSVLAANSPELLEGLGRLLNPGRRPPPLRP